MQAHSLFILYTIWDLADKTACMAFSIPQLSEIEKKITIIDVTVALFISLSLLNLYHTF